MSGAIWIVVAALVTTFVVIVLLVVSKGARRVRSDNSAGTDSGIYFIPASTDFGSTSASDSPGTADNCDTDGWSDGGDAGGGDCGGGDGGGGVD